MPDQTKPNPTGGTAQPTSSFINSIQANQELAWIKLRDQAKTATDVSNMMVDLSPDDFNALSDQIRKAKRYGHKEVTYKGLKLPVPDKPASVLKKLFEEKQALARKKIEQTSTSLSQQVFGTSMNGVVDELGKMLGIKPKKKKEGKKKEKEDTKTERATTSTNKQIPRATMPLQEPGITTGSTGTVRIQQPDVGSTNLMSGGRVDKDNEGGVALTAAGDDAQEAAIIETIMDHLERRYAKNPNIYYTDANNQIVRQKVTQIKRLPKSLEITARGADGKTSKTVLDLSSADNLEKVIIHERNRGDYQLSEESQKLVANLIGSNYITNDNGNLKNTKVIGSEYIHVPNRPDLDMVELTIEGADGQAQKIRFDRDEFRFQVKRQQPALQRELKYRQKLSQTNLPGGTDSSIPESTNVGSVVPPPPTAQPVGAGAIAAGIAGATLGASLESTRKVTAQTDGVVSQAATEQTAAPASVQVAKERKASVTATQTGQQKAPQEAEPGVESIIVKKERKASIETTIPSTAVPPPTTTTTTPSDVRVEREQNVSVSGAAVVSADLTARQRSRAEFHMPGGAPPSGVPLSGLPMTGDGGPSGPRATPTLSTQELLKQADVFVEETKKLTVRMMANPRNFILKAEMHSLRDRASGLMSQISNTQKGISLSSPEHTALADLNNRLEFIKSSLAGGADIGSSFELSAGLELYDRARDKIGNVLAHNGDTTQYPARRIGPSPTGIAGPPVIDVKKPVSGSTFPGPRSPKPIVGTAAQLSATTQMSVAMQLGAAQQQAAIQQMTAEDLVTAEDLTEQEGELTADQSGLTESSVPPDVRSQIMGEQGEQTISSVLPGQYAPPGYEDIYGGGRSLQHQTRQERPPGSAVSSEEPTEEEQMKGGGELVSDEAERASVLAKQQDQARRAKDFAKSSSLPGEKTTRPSVLPGGAQSKPFASRPMPAAGAGKAAGAAVSPVQMAMLLAAQKAAQKAQSILARNEFIRQQMEDMQRKTRNLQNIWRMVNASELTSSKAIFPILMWVVTSNLQLINKYSFKVRFIPPASLVEDAFTMCTDCLLGSSCLMNFILYFTIVALLALPYVIIGGTIVNVFGIEAIRKSLEMLAKMAGLQ